jgi:hypothetical protein
MEWVLSPPGHPEGPECATLRALLESTPEEALSRLAEIGWLLWGALRVCEVLRIGEFTALDPLPAHRYLAYLAREGLVTEIITTNYDCCIERAYRCSFGPDLEGLLDDLDGETPAVIRDLEEYRAKESTLFVAPTGVRRPILRLYKINGCAEHYRRARSDVERMPGNRRYELLAEAAERIILTERQLQTFRNERWALDLFRDRARTRNLLFCGFGSEEPQVRHAALAITQEFQSYREHSDPKEVANLPNAPWVAAYRGLSFYQLQILAGYLHAHMGGKLDSHPLGARIADLLDNVFLGPDACDLGGDAPNLSADRFLRALFERTFCALLGRELEDGTLLTNWLRSRVPEWRTWTECLRTYASIPEPKRCPGTNGSHHGSQVNPSAGPHQQGTGIAPCAPLLEPTGDMQPLRLWAWLWAMRYPSEATSPQPLWYLPVSEEPLLVALTLLLVRALTTAGCPSTGLLSTSDPIRQVRAVDRHGLEVVVPKDGAHSAFRVYLIVEDASMPAWLVPNPSADRREGEGTLRPRLVRRIGVPSSRYRSDRLRIEQRPVEPGGIGTLYVGRTEVSSAAELIRRARVPGEMPVALRRLSASQRVEPGARLERLGGVGQDQGAASR